MCSIVDENGVVPQTAFQAYKVLVMSEAGWQSPVYRMPWNEEKAEVTIKDPEDLYLAPDMVKEQTTGINLYQNKEDAEKQMATWKRFHENDEYKIFEVTIDPATTKVVVGNVMFTHEPVWIVDRVVL